MGSSRQEGEAALAEHDRGGIDLLSASFGPEVCQNYLIYEIVSLQDDPVYKVRKETVKHIVGIAKVVSAEVF